VDCKDVTASPLIDILQKYNLAHESCYFGNDSFLLSLKNEYHEARLMPSISKKEDISWKISLLHPYAFDANWNTLSPEIVKEVHANNIQLFVDLLGPKDNVENYRKAAIMGVDLVQTDKPLLLLKTLRN
jgi:glycerophosphoryl diester phosphodiesterase